MGKHVVGAMVVAAGLFVAGEAWAAQTAQVTIQKVGQGTVTSTPAGIDCGGACQKSFARNERIKLTATAAPGSVFRGWYSPQGSSGAGAGVGPAVDGCPNTSTTCELTLTTSARAIGARFSKSSKLTVRVEDGDGTVGSDIGLGCAAPPPGTTCAKDGVAEQSLVTLTATPATGMRFVNWAGAPCMGPSGAPSSAASQGVTCRFAMPQQDILVRAHFAPATGSGNASLTIVNLPGGAQFSGQGTVTSTPAGIDCGGTCQKSFARNERIQLTATAAPGSIFRGWYSPQAPSGPGARNGPPVDGCPNTSTTCAVTLTTTGRHIGAHFSKSSKLSVKMESGDGAVSGEVACSAPPAGTTCAKDGVAEQTLVTLTATPATGMRFLDWADAPCLGPSGAPSSSAAQQVTCRFTMPQQDILVRARFAPATGSGNASLTIVNLAGGAQFNGQGTVTSTPAGIDCGGACQKSFNRNERIQLTAVAMPGSVFRGWYTPQGSSGAGAGVGPAVDGCPNTSTTCEVTLTTTARHIGAHFSKSSKLSVRVEGADGSVNSDAGLTCAAPPAGNTCAKDDVAEQTLVTLTATPATGMRFLDWVGAPCLGPSGAPSSGASQQVTCRFAMPQQDIVVRARFGPGQ